jgi:hypothetical protein
MSDLHPEQSFLFNIGRVLAHVRTAFICIDELATNDKHFLTAHRYMTVELFSLGQCTSATDPPFSPVSYYQQLPRQNTLLRRKTERRRQYFLQWRLPCANLRHRRNPSNALADALLHRASDDRVVGTLSTHLIHTNLGEQNRNPFDLITALGACTRKNTTIC